MIIDTKLLIPMTAANQNFSRVVRIVDENGMAVILRKNEPQYIVISFSEYEEIQAARSRLISETSDAIIAENLMALKELAK